MTNIYEGRIYNMNSEKRWASLDLLRVIAMLDIVMIHFLSQDAGKEGLLNSLEPDNIRFWLLWGLKVFGSVGVDIFAVLSGYLCCTKKTFNNIRIIELLFTYVFYCSTITILFVVFLPNIFNGSVSEILLNCLPSFKGNYWYITCYFGLFFLMRYLNMITNSLDLKQTKKLLVLLVITYSVIPSLFNVDFFRTNGGLSLVWLVLCYLIGACIRKIDLFKKRSLLLFFCFLSISYMMIVAGVIVYGQRRSYLTGNTSFIFILASIMLLLYFKNKNYENRKLRVIYKYLSLASFDVYIIHAHPLIADNIYKKIGISIGLANPVVCVLMVIIIPILIYLICAIIYSVRLLLFKMFRINRLVEFFGRKLNSILD